MRYLLLTIILLTTLHAAPKEKQHVTDEVAMELLETIKDDAIVLGSGDRDIHVFIDPLCRMSQRYLKLLYKREAKLFSKYTIYIYLHEIKAKKSKKHIFYIISATSAKKVLRGLMLNKDDISIENSYNRKTQESFERIAKVANEIGVYKRPYIMIDGKAK